MTLKENLSEPLVVHLIQAETFLSSWFYFDDLFVKLLLIRTDLDTKYVLLNDEETGLLTYIGNFVKWADQNFNKFSGKKHSKIQFDPDENQWRIEVMNNPKIAASSYAAISTKAIGKKISLRKYH